MIVITGDWAFCCVVVGVIFIFFGEIHVHYLCCFFLCFGDDILGILCGNGGIYLRCCW